MLVPCGASQPPEPHRLGALCPYVQSHHSGGLRQAWHRQQLGHRNGSPSTTTSSLRQLFTGTPRSKSRTHTLVATRLPASRQMRAVTFSTAKPRRPISRPGACGAMMATAVGETATSTHTRGGRQRETQAAQQEELAELRLEANLRCGRHSTPNPTAKKKTKRGRRNAPRGGHDPGLQLKTPRFGALTDVPSYSSLIGGPSTSPRRCTALPCSGGSVASSKAQSTELSELS